jgi:hypothetical protein
MGLIDDASGLAKSAVAIAKAEGSKELLTTVIDLQIKTLELIAENRELRRQVADFEDRIRFKESLQPRNNAYWIGAGDSEAEGPFCTACWDSQGNAVRMHRRAEWADAICPACKVVIKLGERSPDPLRRNLGGIV